MKKKYLAIVAVVIFIIGAIGIALYSLEWEKKETEIGLSEEAKQNPLLAAEMFLANKQITLSKLLQESDFLVNKQITLSTNSTLIIDEAALIEYIGMEQAIIKWVKSGGHLVYLLSSRRDKLAINDNQILALTNVTVHEAEKTVKPSIILEAKEGNLSYKKEHYSVEWYFPYSYYLEDCPGTALRLKNSENVIICDLGLDNGYITFIPSIHPISTAGLRYLDHGELLLWLVGDNSKVWYLPSLQSPNWLLSLWQWSWLVLVLSVMSMLSFMWHVAIRIGLPKTPHSSSKSYFSEHIEAVGNFMIKHQQHRYLKQALLNDLEKAMELRSPRYRQLPVSEQALLVSKLTGKDKKTIEQLLTQELPVDDSARMQFVKTFKQLRNAL